MSHQGVYKNVHTIMIKDLMEQLNWIILVLHIFGTYLRDKTKKYNQITVNLARLN